VTFEEELKRIDVEIKKLKIQFDLFFIGSVPKPPTDQRDALEKQVKALQNNTKSVADRFLYNSLVNKFNAFSELWLKTLKGREEGVRLHPTAARAARRSAREETGGTLGPPRGRSRGNGAGNGGGRGSKSRPAPGEGTDFWRVPMDRHDEGAVRRLYDSFIAAKDKSGDARKPTYETFAREIARHAATLKGRANCDAIDFTIYSSGSKVGIKGKPSK
jgi:hypothetical protein